MYHNTVTQTHLKVTSNDQMNANTIMICDADVVAVADIQSPVEGSSDKSASTASI